MHSWDKGMKVFVPTKRDEGMSGDTAPERRGIVRLSFSFMLIALLLTVIFIPMGFGDTGASRVILPIEVLSADGATPSRTIALETGEAESVRSLWLQVHGVRYANQASVQVNASEWIPLNNSTVTVAEPGRSFGGIGGGFATLAMTVPLPTGTVVSGGNTIRFRFNQTDGVTSAYRVLALNFLAGDVKK